MTTPVEVHQGRIKTPFYDKLKAVDTVNAWHTWAGYLTPDELYCSETEYFAIRNTTGVFDISPMTALVSNRSAKRWYDYITSLLSILGGAFTVVSLLERFAGALA